MNDPNAKSEGKKHTRKNTQREPYIYAHMQYTNTRSLSLSASIIVHDVGFVSLLFRFASRLEPKCTKLTIKNRLHFWFV